MPIFLSLTVSGIRESAFHVYFLPGDTFIYLVTHYLPTIAAFVNMGPGSYHGFSSGVISFLAWAFVVVLLKGTYSLVLELVIKRTPEEHKYATLLTTLTKIKNRLKKDRTKE